MPEKLPDGIEVCTVHDQGTRERVAQIVESEIGDTNGVEGRVETVLEVAIRMLVTVRILTGGFIAWKNQAPFETRGESEYRRLHLFSSLISDCAAELTARAYRFAQASLISLNGVKQMEPAAHPKQAEVGTPLSRIARLGGTGDEITLDEVEWIAI